MILGLIITKFNIISLWFSRCFKELCKFTQKNCRHKVQIQSICFFPRIQCPVFWHCHEKVESHKQWFFFTFKSIFHKALTLCKFDFDTTLESVPGNQPVLSNMGKVSCSRKQQGPLMGVEPTTDTLSVRRASLLYFYIILLKNKKELQTGLHLSLLYMCLFTLKLSNLQAKV